ncbi:MAG TPA: hypothetical protein VKJ65_09645 [Phycisphaerae bacterium]|nr:hypothetical protein [Phycisphaerae bacterium]
MKDIHGIERNRKLASPNKHGAQWKSETHRTETIEPLRHYSAEEIEKRVNAAMSKYLK